MAAFVPHKKTSRILEPSVRVTEDVQDSDVQDTEQALIFPQPPSAQIPRWLRIISSSTHVLVLILSTVIIGLGSHTLAGYSPTRGIHFGGVDISWPKNLDLHPIYFFLIVSAMSMILSFSSGILIFRRLSQHKFSLVEVASAMVSLVMLLFWLAAAFLQHHSELTPKKDLLSWACRRTSSPTNILVRYESICHEQVSNRFSRMSFIANLVSDCYQRYRYYRHSSTLWDNSELRSNMALRREDSQESLNHMEDKTLVFPNLDLFSFQNNRTACCSRNCKCPLFIRLGLISGYKAWGSFRYSKSKRHFGLKPYVLTLNRHMAEVLAQLRVVCCSTSTQSSKRESQAADSPPFSSLRHSHLA